MSWSKHKKGVLASFIVVCVAAFCLGYFSNQVSSETTTRLYRTKPAELSHLSPSTLTPEECRSIEKLLNCEFSYSVRTNESGREVEVSVAVPDNRPSLAVHHKAVDLVIVILRRHILERIEEQLSDLKKFQDDQKSPEWLKNRGEELLEQRRLAKTDFKLLLSSESPHTHFATQSRGLPTFVAVIVGLILLGSIRSFHRKTSEVAPPTAGNTGECPPSRPRLAKITVASPIELPHDDPRTSPLLQALCEQVTRSETQVILILGDSGQDARTDFTLKLASHLSREKRVKMVDFDLKNHPLSTRLGREHSLGVSDFMVHGGPRDEFFSSLTGLDVEFSPAGQTDAINGEVPETLVQDFFSQRSGGLLLVDACTTSPLHLVVHHVDTVLYVDPRRPENLAESAQGQVLLAFREARIPVWAITSSKLGFFPMI